MRMALPEQLTITFKNWGDVQGNSVEVDVLFSHTLPKRYGVRELGDIFPGQETALTWDVPLPEGDFVNIGANVAVMITYKSPGAVGVFGHGYGHHRLSQSSWVIGDEWGRGTPPPKVESN